MNDEKRRRVTEEVLECLTGFRTLRSHSLSTEPLHREISLPQLQVLAMLREQPVMTVSDIARALSASMPSASSLADRLEDRGLANRTRDGADRRVVSIALTDKGRQVVDEFVGVKREHMTRVMSQMTDTELEQFLGGMLAFRNALERATQAVGSKDSVPQALTV